MGTRPSSWTLASIRPSSRGRGRLVGALTYVVDSPRCEVLTLHASEHRRGVGTALLEVEDVARVAGAGSSG